jgi:hypothetical protein
MEPSSFVAQWTEYSVSGSSEALSQLCKGCISQIDSGSALDDQVDVGFVKVCVSRLLESILAQRPALDAWVCVCFLMDPFRYAGAKRVLAMLLGYPNNLTGRILRHIATVISACNCTLEVRSAFIYVGHFLAGGPHHQNAVGKEPELWTAISRYIEGEFLVRAETHEFVLKALANFISWNGPRRGGVDMFDYLWSALELGVLRMITLAMLHVAHTPPPRPDLNMAVPMAYAALQTAIETIIAIRPEQSAGLLTSTYTIPPSDLSRLDQAVYQHIRDPPQDDHLYLLQFVGWYIKYLCQYCAPGSSERFLIHQYPVDLSAPPFVVLLRTSACQHRASELLASLRCNADIYSSVSELWNSVPPPPSLAKMGKRRYCAYTGCRIDGEGLSGPEMLKCGKCKKAYYCGKEHQRLDWHKGHKLFCSVSTR